MPYKNVPEELWGKMDDCVTKVQAKGHDKPSAVAICYASIVEGNSSALDFVLNPDEFISKREDVSKADKARAVKEYGDVNFADEKNKKYPLDDEEHIRSAWSYINQARNAAKYSPAEVAAIKRKIIAAWVQKIDKAGPPSMMEWGDMYLIDEYVSTKPGEPYRLFPFGRIVKNGKTHDITPAIAATFKLPHFKPAIKRGSHEETTPADGHIIGLEVREDGLYAIPEYTETGQKDLEVGAYRYHSPEVIWEDSGLEDPQTGQVISGPLIVGDALLHMPHLGEAAALFEITPILGGETMEEEMKIPVSLWDKIKDKIHFGDKPEPEKLTVEVIKPPEDYEALKVKVTEFEAMQAKAAAEAAQKVRIDTFAAQLKETKVPEGADILAGMSDEQAAWVVTQFKALSAQIKESNLTGEIGSTGDALPEDPRQAQDKAIKAYAEEKKVDYVTALKALAHEQPELFAAGKK